MFITYQLGFRACRWVIALSALVLTACESDRGAGVADVADRQTSQYERGEILSYACLACHTLDRSGDHQIGPNLHGVFGRTAGKLPGFNYSPALRDSGIVWTPAELENWLADPAGFLPGTTMAFTGYRQPDDRRALIEFLVAATAP